jgi:hypothetical protein
LITEALETLEQDLREAATQASNERSQKRDSATTDDLLEQVAELRRAVQSAQHGNQQSPSGNDNGNGNEPGAAEGSSESQVQSARNGGPGAQDGLTAWNPIAPVRSLTNLEDGRGSLTQQTAAIGQRIRELTTRMTGGELTQAELDALRRNAQQLRRLSGDPMAEQSDAMLKLIDQIELTALNAAARVRGNTPAHATLPPPDSPRYREAVAEYYRRLGNR